MIGRLREAIAKFSAGLTPEHIDPVASPPPAKTPASVVDSYRTPDIVRRCQCVARDPESRGKVALEARMVGNVSDGFFPKFPGLRSVMDHGVASQPSVTAHRPRHLVPTSRWSSARPSLTEGCRPSTPKGGMPRRFQPRHPNRFVSSTVPASKSAKGPSKVPLRVEKYGNPEKPTSNRARPSGLTSEDAWPTQQNRVAMRRRSSQPTASTRRISTMFFRATRHPRATGDGFGQPPTARTPPTSITKCDFPATTRGIQSFETTVLYILDHSVQ